MTVNGSTDIKQVHIDNHMHYLSILTMNNKNVVALMIDCRVLQRPNLTSTIITSIQSLLPLQQQQSQASSLVILSDKGARAMKEMPNYTKDMVELCNEYKTINHKYEIEKVENNEIIKKYQILCNQ